MLAQIVNVLYNICGPDLHRADSGGGGCGPHRRGRHLPDHHDHFRLFRLCQRRVLLWRPLHWDRGDRKRAERILGNCVSMLFFTVILMAFFLRVQKPLLYVFGGQWQYDRLFLDLHQHLSSRHSLRELAVGPCSPYWSRPWSMSCWIRFFIFVFHMGVAGAAAAVRALKRRLGFAPARKNPESNAEKRHEAGFSLINDHGPWH